MLGVQQAIQGCWSRRRDQTTCESKVARPASDAPGLAIVPADLQASFIESHELAALPPGADVAAKFMGNEVASSEALAAVQGHACPCTRPVISVFKVETI